MTWNGQCPTCSGWTFKCTINSTDDIHVNCDHCDTYIGMIPADRVQHALTPEPH